MRVDVFARCPDSDSHDNVVSVQLAVRHLAEFDHTRIGLAVGPPQRLLERGATAIVYGSHLMEFTDPPLTTIRQDVVAMGEAAVRALLEEIEGSTTRRGEHLFRPELVVRSSTGPVPTTPPSRR